jgi:hypothetical protein
MLVDCVLPQEGGGVPVALAQAGPELLITRDEADRFCSNRSRPSASRGSTPNEEM